ncbi:DUF6894 family protein [Methylobacterium crusticola]|uniref:DUF6894 family protein n=1 Tax=Methylobacterium crusticola TaxID=1697972 RepID=UPI00387E9092
MTASDPATAHPARPRACERCAALSVAEIGKDRLPTRKVREIAIDVRDAHGQRLLTASVSMQIERIHSPLK